MASPPNIEDPTQINHRAKVRIGVAIVLLVTAVTILAVLNQRSVPGTKTFSPGPQETISDAQVVMPPAATQPTPNSISSPPPPAAEIPNEPPPPPVPGSLPPVPEAAPPPSPAKPAAAENTASAKPVMVAAEAWALPPVPAHPAETKPATPAPAQTTSPRDFQVQVGVFSDPENAKQLQAKLAEHGIPSHMETRLQVGPFKTQAEAEAAKEKLKTLGVNAVITPGK